MSKYQNKKGYTTADDPTRLIWYGPCGHWTDEWDLLSNTPNGIPICPKCKSPGYQTTAQHWFAQIDAYEEDSHPGYREEVMKTRLSRPIMGGRYA